MLIPLVAQVAVQDTAYSFDKAYSYTVPGGLSVQPGCRVLVPFGGSNRKRQGMVLSLEQTAAVAKLKPIAALLDHEPVLDAEMLALALWLKERTFCTVYDAVRAMLPAGLDYRIKPRYKLSAAAPSGAALLPVDEQRMLAAVREHPDGIAEAQLLAGLGLEKTDPMAKRLANEGFLARVDEAALRIGDTKVRMVRPALPEDEMLSAMAAAGCTDRQKSVCRLLIEVGAASVREVCYFTGVTEAVLRALIKKGLAECYEQPVMRRPYRADATPDAGEIHLNPSQQRALDGLMRQWESSTGSAALLFGVTGSGKTQVYMKLIDRVVASGRQAIVMVPEIALTPQTVELFIARYGDRVAVIHSGLSVGERTDEWKRIRNAEASIVVGTRSAVFAPCRRLGLIVMDEEQEHTYKSESAPRYHARDAAKFRCAHHGAMLLLASATPSIESYHAAQTGRYAFYELNDRFGGAGLPEVRVVDMRSEDSVSGCISAPLQAALAQCVQQQRQAILLLNRRGYDTQVSCRSCGYVITCPSCSISLTYHKSNSCVICHYCGHRQPKPDCCPECGSGKLRFSGIGTQKAEQELTRLLPQAKILRMDTDTTMSRFAYDRQFRAFGAGEYDIMIGTQMVAKGLDFPRVGLVGVLSADQALYESDYRSFESAFNLLTQVIGRAGRREDTGLAVVQTFTPESYIIALAAAQDYPGFYRIEIAARKEMRYPPYTDICQMAFVGQQEQAAAQAADWAAQTLRHMATREFCRLPIIAFDPTPATVLRVAGKYRYKLIAKTVNGKLLREMIGRIMAEFARQTAYKTVTMTVDINPTGIL